MSNRDIVDVMTLLPDHSPYFVVNTGVGVLSVNIRRPLHVPAYDYHLRSAGGKRTFVKGDNLIILSAGFVFPESFGLAGGPSNLLQNNPSVSIGAQVVGGGGIFFLPNFSVDGVIMPIENYEFPLNIFVDINAVNPPVYTFRTNNFNLYCLLSGLNEGAAIYPQVSMVGVPSVLNGTTQHLTVFLKVLHNFDLI